MTFLGLAARGAGSPLPPLTVERVEINAYVGKWYEIRRIPNSFQDNNPRGLSACYGTTAEYTLRDDGRINVENTCLRRDANGREQSEVARALARVIEGSGGAKLKVNFTGLAVLRWLGIGDGNYWILGLGPVESERYSWAFVGSPKRDFGWILSRDPQPSAETLETILQLAESRGYRREQFASPSEIPPK